MEKMEETTLTRHAYLIIAHNQPHLLQLLVSLLDDERNDIFILLDAKSRDERLRNITVKRSRLTYVPSIAIWWGEVSQIESELVLFDSAFRQGPYRYYHLLSGQDLPLKSQDEIHHFFDSQQGAVFMEAGAKDEWIGKRLRKHYFHNYKHEQRRTWWQEVQRFLQRQLLSLQKRLLPEPRIDWLPQLAMGSNWVSLPQEAVAYVLERRQQIERSFKHSFCCDEVFLQSVLWNSPFFPAITNNNLRYIDWNRGKPYTFQYEDLAELEQSGKLFARKFSEADERLMQYFEQKVY